MTCCLRLLALKNCDCLALACTVELRLSSGAAQQYSRTRQSGCSVRQSVVCHQQPKVQQRPAVAQEERKWRELRLCFTTYGVLSHTCYVLHTLCQLVASCCCATVCRTFNRSCAAVCYLSTAPLPVMTVHRTPLFVDLRALCWFWPFVATRVLLSGMSLALHVHRPLSWLCDPLTSVLSESHYAVRLLQRHAMHVLCCKSMTQHALHSRGVLAAVVAAAHTRMRCSGVDSPGFDCQV
jgi:hypothetical protein